MEILKFRLETDPALSKRAHEIRRIVFIEEQQVEHELEYEFEDVSTHYLLIDKDKDVATARWRETSNGIKLERFATLKKERGKGYAAALLKRMIVDVLPMKKIIYLNSQVSALAFYEKFGFVKEGDVFVEADIEHFLMVYMP